METSAPSPGDSDAGPHAKGNWNTVSSSLGSKAAASPQPVPNDENPDLAEFRKQSEAYAFSLGNLHRLNSFNNASSTSSASSPLARPVERSATQAYFPQSAPSESVPKTGAKSDRMDIDTAGSSQSPKSGDAPAKKFQNRPADPVRSSGFEQQLSHIDERQHRLSLTENRVSQGSPPGRLQEDSRANSLPHSLGQGTPSMMSPDEFATLYELHHPHNMLLFDLRVAPQYGAAHIGGALNLCIPTTLLKRPSFNVPRLADAFTRAEDKTRFAQWNQVQFIAVYDANSSTVRDATSAVNTLRKFTNEGWTGVVCIVRGGFQALSKQTPQLVEKSESSRPGGLNKKNLSLDAGDLQVAGGCPMPATKTAASPFFGNIRQNMDLIGGVGQMEISLPDAVNQRTFEYLPSWLQQAVAAEDKGKAVSAKFLEIEEAEQRRMQAALSGDVHYGTPQVSSSGSVQMAGIEKGAKNRYKDILPFDHTRVKLKNAAASDCDYINASYVKAEWSHRRYIASQAPIPATFEV